MQNVRPASDNAPIWQKERRSPTRAELAAKHATDQPGTPSPAVAPVTSLSTGEAIEFDEPTTAVKVRRFK